jgi:hypothetical protein
MMFLLLLSLSSYLQIELYKVVIVAQVVVNHVMPFNSLDIIMTLDTQLIYLCSYSSSLELILQLCVSGSEDGRKKAIRESIIFAIPPASPPSPHPVKRRKRKAGGPVAARCRVDGVRDLRRSFSCGWKKTDKT